jgi:hypothetical protein
MNVRVTDAELDDGNDDDDDSEYCKFVNFSINYLFYFVDNKAKKGCSYVYSQAQKAITTLMWNDRVEKLSRSDFRTDAPTYRINVAASAERFKACMNSQCYCIGVLLAIFIFKSLILACHTYLLTRPSPDLAPLHMGHPVQTNRVPGDIPAGAIAKRKPLLVVLEPCNSCRHISASGCVCLNAKFIELFNEKTFLVSLLV